MIEQTIGLELIQIFNGARLEKNHNIATMFAQSLSIFKLFI